MVSLSIRIPQEVEVDCGPLDYDFYSEHSGENHLWKSVIYEVWSHEQIFEHLMEELRIMKYTLCDFCPVKFNQRRDAVVEGISFLRRKGFFTDNSSKRSLLANMVEGLKRTVDKVTK